MSILVWNLLLVPAIAVAVLMGFGLFGNADAGKSFAVLLVIGLCGGASFIVWNRLFRTGNRHRAVIQAPVAHPRTPGPDFFSKAFSVLGKTMEEALLWTGDKLLKLGSWAGTGAKNNPLAAASVVAWIVVLACLSWLAWADERFWPTVMLMITFHVATGFSLAWDGKLSAVMSEIASNYKALAWIWLSTLSAVLAAIHGYEEGFVEWWKYPPFLLAFLSVLLAGVVAAGFHEQALKAIGKALFAWHGPVTLCVWGMILVIISFMVQAMVGHDFFKTDTRDATFNIFQWVVAAGFSSFFVGCLVLVAKNTK